MKKKTKKSIKPKARKAIAGKRKAAKKRPTKKAAKKVAPKKSAKKAVAKKTVKKAAGRSKPQQKTAPKKATNSRLKTAVVAAGLGGLAGVAMGSMTRGNKNAGHEEE